MGRSLSSFKVSHCADADICEGFADSGTIRDVLESILDDVVRLSV